MIMATIDIKLKTYEQLQFEIMKLNIDIVLKGKEIEELNDLLHKANDEVVSYADECIRLNNIMDELEKHLIAMSKIYEEEYKDIDTSEHYKSMLNKLKELKEGKENDK